MARARFLLRPLWLLSHVLVVALIVVMINLGFWQLDRLDQRRDRNAVIEQRTDLPVVSVDELVDPDASQAAIDDARFREVSVTGTYDDAATVVVRNRTQDGAPGAWLVTPLDLGTGEQVGVIRGFVNFGSDGDIDEPPPPTGVVTVAGAVIDPGKLDGTAPGDLEALLSGADTLPVVVRADESDPAEPSAADMSAGTSGTIRPVPTGEMSEGPHFGYAMQWFIFATIGIIGYPLVLRSVVRRRAAEAGQTEEFEGELEDLLRQGG